jgi:hypothetical protein
MKPKKHNKKYRVKKLITETKQQEVVLCGHVNKTKQNKTTRRRKKKRKRKKCPTTTTAT